MLHLQALYTMSSFNNESKPLPSLDDSEFTLQRSVSCGFVDEPEFTLQRSASCGSNYPCENPIIKGALIMIHNVPLSETDLRVVDNPDASFGILEIEVAETKQTDRPTYIEFDIDISGSMNDGDGDGVKRKIDFVKKTLESMCQFIAEQPTAVIYIKVNTFDDHYKTIIPATRITLENRTELINIISKVEPNGCTNIENTFTKSGKSIEEYKDLNPTHKVVYVLLTDGNPTTGNTSIKYLISKKPNAENKCIGFGSDHNASLLIGCGDYYFINDFENTGKVYGEILHKLLYPAIEDVTIRLNDGKIYDSKTNSWEDSITIPDLYSGQKREFHIKTAFQEPVAVIYGRVVGILDDVFLNDNIEELYTASVLPNLCDEDNVPDNIDLMKYMYRQRTQELMFESIEYTDQSTVNNAYKPKLQSFFKQMRNYMRENNLLEDPFMNLLCDDIQITFKTFGTENAKMYTVSRHRSQGQQSACRASSQPVYDRVDRCGYIQRAMATTDNEQFNEDEYDDEYLKEPDEDDLRYFVSQNNDDNLYADSKIQRTMRGVSGV